MRSYITSWRPWYKQETVTGWSDQQVLRIHTKLLEERRNTVKMELLEKAPQVQQPRLFNESEPSLNPIVELIKYYSIRILDGTLQAGLTVSHDEHWMAKTSVLRQGFRRVILYRENNQWTVTLLQSNPLKVINAGNKVMVYLEDGVGTKITRQVRRDKDGYKMIFFDKSDSAGNHKVMALGG